MSFYTDFIDQVADNTKIFEKIGHQLFAIPEYRIHAAEWSIFSTVTDFMKQAVIIRLRGEQSAIFLDTPFDPQQDFIQWLRLPYDVIYIQPDTPFRFTGYAPKTEGELRVWAQNHKDALTQEERKRLEHLREQPEPNIHGVLLFDATKYLDPSKKNWLPHELAAAQRYDMLQTIEGIDFTTIERLFHVVFLMPLQDYPMNIHSFTIGVLKNNTIWCAKRTSTEAILTRAQQWVIHLINFLSSPSVKLVRNQPDAESPAINPDGSLKPPAPQPLTFPIIVTKVIYDQPVQIEITGDLWFQCALNGRMFSAKTWDDLEDSVKRQMKISKIEHNIPLVLERDRHPKYFRATLRGRHFKHGYLFTVDGEKTTIEHPRVINFGEAITDAQLDALNAASRAVTDAKNAENGLAHEASKGTYFRAEAILDTANNKVLAKDPA